MPITVDLVIYTLVVFAAGVGALYLYMVLSGKWADYKAAHPSEAAIIESAVMFAIAWVERQGIVGSATKLKAAVNMATEILDAKGVQASNPVLIQAINNNVSDLNNAAILDVHDNPEKKPQ